MIEELLRTLTELPGPTGGEEAVLGWLEEEWRERGEVTRSRVGNLTLRIPGPGPRVVVAAGRPGDVLRDRARQPLAA